MNQISCYCLPRNVKDKTVEELTELMEMGLKEVYIGCESGDNEVGRSPLNPVVEHFQILRLTLHALCTRKTSDSSSR